MDRLTKAVLSFGGLGLLPLVPGTWGTLGALGLAFLLPAGGWAVGAGAAALAACLVTVLLGRRAERLAGGKDPQFVVTDEVAGYFVTVAWLAKPEPGWLILGFFVFRALDIVKPWPGRRLERLPHGTGVLLDDLAAGLYGLVLLLLARAAWGAWMGA